jgi:hypothetical protein
VDFGPGAARLTALNDGKIGIGTMTPGYQLHTVITGSTAVAGFTNSVGTCTIIPNTASLSCSSDIRLKKNFEKIIGLDALNKIINLQAMTYQWKSGDDEARHIGYIAQEVEKIVPGLVRTGDDGFKQVSYSGFVPLLSEAIKEVHADVQGDKARVTALETENNAIKRDLASVKERADKAEQENAALRQDLQAIKKKLGID